MVRADTLAINQLMLAQAVDALADHLNYSTGYAFAPMTFATLGTKIPTPSVGMVVCISDSTVNTWGTTIAGGGTFNVLAWYNGAHWTVAGA